jgi:hypothetical protein
MRRLALLASLALGACAERAYYYAPEAAAVVRGGMPTHVESIPQESPRGTLDVSTLGLTKGPRGESALHVRMTLDNEGDDQPWTVDIRDQLVDIPGVGRSAPLSANAGVQNLPTITVPRRERRVVDLYYPAPPSVREPEQLVGFDFLWDVKTPTRDVSGRTRIDRREVIERPPTVYVSSWGPYWWYDPYYPHLVYRPIIVGHAWRWHHWR